MISSNVSSDTENLSASEVQIEFVTSNNQKKNFFKDACSYINSKERRNVPKYIVREVIKYVLFYPGRIYKCLTKYYDFGMKEFDNYISRFRKLRNLERNRITHKDAKMNNSDLSFKRDYVKIINKFTSDPYTFIMLNEALKGILDKLRKTTYEQINNLNVYLETVEALYDKTNSIINIHETNDEQ